MELFELELDVLLSWLRKHPGLTRQEFAYAFKDDSERPAPYAIEWKLRYLELRGDVWGKKNPKAKHLSARWFPTIP